MNLKKKCLILPILLTLLLNYDKQMLIIAK